MSEHYGEMVARLRAERGWTQRDLARESGVPYRTVQEVEGVKHKNGPQRATRRRLNAALDIEGEPASERSEWDEDVLVILDVVGAYLMTLTPTERLQWLRETITDAFHR